MTLWVFYLAEDETKTALRKEKTLELKEEAEGAKAKPSLRKRKTHEISVYGDGDDEADQPPKKKGRNFYTLTHWRKN